MKPQAQDTTVANWLGQCTDNALTERARSHSGLAEAKRSMECLETTSLPRASTVAAQRSQEPMAAAWRWGLGVASGRSCDQ